MSHNEFPEPLPRAVDRPRNDSGRAIQKVSARTAGLGGGMPINRIIPSRQRRKIGKLAKQALVDWNTDQVRRFGEVEGYIGERLSPPELPW